MRAPILVSLLVLVSGCSEPSADADDASGDGNHHEDGNHTAPLVDLVEANATLDNGTAANDTVANVTAAPAAPAIVVQQSFTGLLPVDGLSKAHTFEVPEGSTRLEVIYTSDHVGLFAAVADAKDPLQARRLYSLETCPGTSPGAVTTVCTMTLEEALLPGAWTTAVFWQAGQATEEYTLAVTVWGVLPA